MGTLRWYKRDPRAALTGMMELTLEERGAYNTILDLIYAHDGELLDDPAVIVPWLGVDVRVWKRIRRNLVDKGKLYVHAGCLHNERADHEIHEALLRVASLTEVSNKWWATYRKIKGLSNPKGVTPTTTISKYLSAKIVPIAPHKTPDKKK
jgi:uncharacterized protein YdaU (DUF1376 family)